MCQPQDFVIPFSYVSHKWNACIILVKYRLAPEFKSPIGCNDFKDAFLHFYDRAHEFGIDANRMAMAGESGGCHI